LIISRSTYDYVQRPGRLVVDPFEGTEHDAFSVRVVKLDGNERRTPHLHPESQEVIYVVRGEGMLWEDGKSQRFVEGDCALVDAGVPHATVPDTGTKMELVCFFAHPDLPANTRELPDISVPASEKPKLS
jgi:quercetin dioxygenase-like cupin family protein